MPRGPSDYRNNIIDKLNNGYILYRDSIENKWYIKRGDFFEQIKTCTGKSLLKSGTLKQLREGNIFNNKEFMEIYMIKKRGG